MQVKNFIDATQLKEDMAYSLADLTSAMASQASLFVYYGTLHAKAAKQLDDLEMLLEIAESKVYRTLRDAAIAAGEKPSVAHLEKEVQAHKKVVEFKRAVNEAKQIEAVAKTAVEAMKQRRDMLIQHGASEREDRKGELRVMERTQAESVARQLARSHQ